jgi:di/tricarboxylate transporter
MLPIATPTNSVIFASGYVNTKDMVILFKYKFKKIPSWIVIIIFIKSLYQAVF